MSAPLPGSPSFRLGRDFAHEWLQLRDITEKDATIEGLRPIWNELSSLLEYAQQEESRKRRGERDGRPV